MTHRTDKQLGAMVADTSQDFDDSGYEANVEDWLGQLNVPKIPWRVSHISAICCALHPPVHGPQPGISQPSSLGLSTLIANGRIDLGNRVSPLQISSKLGRSAQLIVKSRSRRGSAYCTCLILAILSGC